jgi:hypothetical protein
VRSYSPVSDSERLEISKVELAAVKGLVLNSKSDGTIVIEAQGHPFVVRCAGAA